MIYRRIPTSYAARIRVMEKALDRINHQGNEVLPLPSEIVNKYEKYYDELAPLVELRTNLGNELLVSLSKERRASKLVANKVLVYMQYFQSGVKAGKYEPDERRQYFGLSPSRQTLGIPRKPYALAKRASVYLGLEAQHGEGDTHHAAQLGLRLKF